MKRKRRQIQICLFKMSFFILGLLFVVNASSAEKPLGNFKLIGKTFYNHSNALQGFKLKNGDVLIYSFTRYKTEPNGAIVSGVGEKMDEYKQLEIYRTKTRIFEPIATPSVFSYYKAIELQDGRVLFAGATCTLFRPDIDTPEELMLCDESPHVQIW